MQYTLTQQAADDLVDINIYTYNEWGENQMLNYHNDLTSAFQNLAESKDLITPIYVVYIDPTSQHYYIKCKHHVIFYEWIDDSVLILRILHNRSDIITAIELLQ